jgi:hypothetical protein
MGVAVALVPAASALGIPILPAPGGLPLPPAPGQPPAEPAPAPPAPEGVSAGRCAGGAQRGATASSWRSGFEGGDFREWTWWGQGQEHIWGHISIVDPAAYRVARLQGRLAARFETTRADVRAGRYHAKLYRGFSIDRRSPADVSGTYRAFFYLPRNYRVPRRTWVNLFQFKEDYWRGEWWVGAIAARDARRRSRRPLHPAIGISSWGGGRRTKYRLMPLGRWVEIRAEVCQGDRIEFYVDGELLDTALARQYPVNPFRERSERWTFGVGNYSTGANGPLLVDDVSYRPR